MGGAPVPLLIRYIWEGVKWLSSGQHCHLTARRLMQVFSLASLGGICIFSLCLSGFSLGSPASWSPTNVHVRWTGSSKLTVDVRWDWLWLFVSLSYWSREPWRAQGELLLCSYLLFSGLTSLSPCVGGHAWAEEFNPTVMGLSNFPKVVIQNV